MRLRLFFGLCLISAVACGGSLSVLSYADETPAQAKSGESEKDIEAALAELTPADRAAAQAQRWCAVMPESRLGAMGKPIKLTLEGKPVFLCCAQCEKEARANAKGTLTKAEKLKKATAAVAKLSAGDRKVAESQRYCAVQVKNELGSMGTPIKVVLEGQPVFLCCAGCKKAATANPKATLAKLKERAAKSGHDHEHHN